MNMEVSNEARVKDEHIDDSQSISETREITTSNTQQSIKHEKQFIPICDSKRTREAFSSDYKPNKRKRQSIKVKEEQKESEIQTSKEIKVKAEEKFSEAEEFANNTSIAFLNEETTTTTSNNDSKSK